MTIYGSEIDILKNRVNSLMADKKKHNMTDELVASNIIQFTGRLSIECPITSIVEILDGNVIGEDVLQLVLNALIETVSVGTNSYLVDDDMFQNKEERIISLIRYLIMSPNIANDWLSVRRIIELLPADIFNSLDYLHILNREDRKIAFNNLEKLVSAYTTNSANIDVLFRVFGRSLISYIPSDKLKDFILSRGIWFINGLPFSDLILYFNSVIDIVRMKCADDITIVTKKLVGVLHEHLSYHCNGISLFDTALFEALSYIKVLDPLLRRELITTINNNINNYNATCDVVYQINNSSSVSVDIIEDVKYSYMSKLLLDDMATEDIMAFDSIVKSRDNDLVASVSVLHHSSMFMNALVSRLSLGGNNNKLYSYVLQERDLIMASYIKMYKPPVLKELNILSNKYPKEAKIPLHKVYDILGEVIYGLDVSRMKMNISDDSVIDMLRQDDFYTLLTTCARYARSSVEHVLEEDSFINHIFERCSTSAFIDLFVSNNNKTKEIQHTKKLTPGSFYANLMDIMNGNYQKTSDNKFKELLNIQLSSLLTVK